MRAPARRPAPGPPIARETMGGTNLLAQRPAPGPPIAREWSNVMKRAIVTGLIALAAAAGAGFLLLPPGTTQRLLAPLGISARADAGRKDDAPAQAESRRPLPP